MQHWRECGCPGAQLLPHIWDYSRQGSHTSSPAPEDREFTVKKLLFYYIQKHARIYCCGILFYTNSSWWQLVVVIAQKRFSFSYPKTLFFSGQDSTQVLENHLYEQNPWLPPCRFTSVFCVQGWNSPAILYSRSSQTTECYPGIEEKHNYSQAWFAQEFKGAWPKCWCECEWNLTCISHKFLLWRGAQRMLRTFSTPLCDV